MRVKSDMVGHCRGLFAHRFHWIAPGQFPARAEATSLPPLEEGYTSIIVAVSSQPGSALDRALYRRDRVGAPARHGRRAPVDHGGAWVFRRVSWCSRFEVRARLCRGVGRGRGVSVEPRVLRRGRSRVVPQGAGVVGRPRREGELVNAVEVGAADRTLVSL